MSNKTIATIFCISSFLFAFAINELNLKLLKDERNETGIEQLRYNETIAGPDDSDYFTPPQNFWSGKGWMDDSHVYGKSAYFWRSPGYMLLYAACIKPFGIPVGHALIKYIQLTIFSLSIYCLFYVLFMLTNSRLWSILFTSIYGLTPIGPGILYLTLTESISPAFVIFFIYFLLRGFYENSNRRKNLFYVLASLFIGYTIFIRPALALLAFTLPLVLYFDYSRNNSLVALFKKLIIFNSIAISFITVWEIRNASITGKFESPQPLYYSESNIVYRPALKHIWGFTKCWGEDATVLNTYILTIWFAAIKGDTSYTWIDKGVAGMPQDIVKEIGEQRIRNGLLAYQKSTTFQKTFYDQKLPMPHDIPVQEMAVIDTFKSFKSEFISNHPFRYYLGSPFIYFKRMVFHSCTGTYFLFQQKFRHLSYLNGIRFLCFALHTSIYLIFFTSIFLFLRNKLVLSIGLSVLFYMFFILFIHREVDQRYFTPVLVLVLMVSAVCVQHVFSLLKPSKS